LPLPAGPSRNRICTSDFHAKTQGRKEICSTLFFGDGQRLSDPLFFWQHFPSCTLQVTGCKGIAEREQPATFNLQPATARQSLQLWLRLCRAKVSLLFNWIAPA
jgi:hypothetical protein